MKDIPRKWTKRGPQPEIKPEEPSQAVKVARLLAEIRECVDPNERARLEAEFETQRIAYEAIAPELNIAEVYKEAVCAIIPEGDYKLPDEITKPQWLDFHARLVKVKRMAAGWLSKSRKFASDRWGVDFVTQAEVQMELDLGIDHIDKPRGEATGIMRIAPSIESSFDRILALIAKDESPKEEREKVITILIDDALAFVDKLRGMG